MKALPWEAQARHASGETADERFLAGGEAWLVTGRVLVADHDDVFREELAAALREAGYEVEATGSDAVVVERVRLQPPDLLIWSTRMEMETFKRLDPWNPRSAVASIPRIQLGVPSADSRENDRLERVPAIPAPLLMGRRPMPVASILEAVRDVLPPEQHR